MPTATVPTGQLTKWGKYAWRALIESTYYFDNLYAGINHAAAVEDYRWLHLQLVYRRTGAVSSVDDAEVCGFDIVNITAGDVDPTFDAGDLTAIEAKVVAFQTAIGAVQSTRIRLAEARFYMRQFQPAGTIDPNHPYPPAGPPFAVVAYNMAGAATTSLLPPQCAMSITERTSVPKHWGRFYLPGVAVGQLDQFGRFGSAAVNAAATATHDFYDSLAADQYTVVVPSFVSRSLSNVTHVQVDDIVDVIRSRRDRTTLLRVIQPALE